jgi:DNA-binding HxlR family transcriptional regulator
MGGSYHQFCPVAKAMELLDERWTLLVIRELVIGSRRFNDLRRGLPRMSPTLLSKRLQQLTRAGIVERQADGGDVRYELTEAGHELRPIVEALGAWGTRWIGELGDTDLDPQLLLWDMQRNVDHAAVPLARTVIRFEFPDLPARTRWWWLVLAPDDADACDDDPGHPVDVSMRGTLRTLTEVWRGDRVWTDALRTGELELSGPEDLRRALPGWFTLSAFAGVPRPAAAR